MPYNLGDVHEFSQRQSKKSITKLEEWHRYLRRYEAIAGKLKISGVISEEQFHQYLWAGIEATLRPLRSFSTHLGSDTTSGLRKIEDGNGDDSIELISEVRGTRNGNGSSEQVSIGRSIKDEPYIMNDKGNTTIEGMIKGIEDKLRLSLQLGSHFSTENSWKNSRRTFSFSDRKTYANIS